MKFIRYIIYFLFCLNALQAQDIAIGQWRDHLPYQKTKDVAAAGNIIYCATDYGLFSYNRTTNELERLSKITGLSDFGVNAIEYNNNYNTLLIAYTNANIDLIKGNTIINISDIKRKNIIGKKYINNIYFYGQYAYLSCGFGIVVLDVEREEVHDTYYIGENGKQIEVYDIVFANNKIYAATEKGIYEADLNNPNLANFMAWTLHQGLPQTKYNAITSFNNYIITNRSSSTWDTDTLFYYDENTWKKLDTSFTSTLFSLYSTDKILYSVHYNFIQKYNDSLQKTSHIWTYLFSLPPQPRKIIVDEYDTLWIADELNGLVKQIGDWSYQSFCPQGPKTANVSDISIENNILWTVAGGMDQSLGNLWRKEPISIFENNSWTSIDYTAISGLDTLTDIHCVVINPNNSNSVFLGSWGDGLLEFNNKNFVTLYTPSNTNNALTPVIAENWYWIGIGGLVFDDNNNLWITNPGSSSPLVVRKNDGSWKSFYFGSSFIGKSGGDIVIDDYNQKWFILMRGNGLVVFNDNNTIDNPSDDQYKLINTQIGSGNLPTMDIQCIAKDLNGDIWVGAKDGGIAVFYSPENVFIPNADFDAQRILITQNGHAQYLLEFENVTCIAVDGANKKWFGTQNAGVFVTSEDGEEQIHHFDVDNSPLFSNTITSIAIDHKTGEVFIGTDKGIISYKGTATEGGDDYEDVYAYPNPVPPNYNGLIAIKGLVRNANVKITDISGTLVYETTAQGGQAIWNAKTFNGQRVRSGVYLIFCTNDDGSKTYITKILVIN